MKDYRAVNGRVNGKLLEMAVSGCTIQGEESDQNKARQRFQRLAPQSPSFIVHFVNKNS